MFRPAAIAFVATVFLNVASFAAISAKPYAVGNCPPNCKAIRRYLWPSPANPRVPRSWCARGTTRNKSSSLRHLP